MKREQIASLGLNREFDIINYEVIKVLLTEVCHDFHYTKIPLMKRQSSAVNERNIYVAMVSVSNKKVESTASSHNRKNILAPTRKKNVWSARVNTTAHKLRIC